MSTVNSQRSTVNGQQSTVNGSGERGASSLKSAFICAICVIRVPHASVFIRSIRVFRVPKIRVPNYRTPNLYTHVCRYVSPGSRRVDGKLEWLGLSGNFCVSNATASRCFNVLPRLPVTVPLKKLPL